MSEKKKQAVLVKVVDDTTKISKKQGNGTLKIQVSVDAKGRLQHYSLAYINLRLCHVDNGRVLGYDNSHGYHHRHYMGTEEPVDFKNFEAIQKKFEKEWREIHEQAKKGYS